MEAHLAVMGELKLFLNLGGAEISVATVVGTAAEVSLGASGRRRLGLLAEEEEKEEEVEGEEGTCSHDPNVWTFMAASTYELCERMDMKATKLGIYTVCERGGDTGEGKGIHQIYISTWRTPMLCRWLVLIG